MNLFVLIANSIEDLLNFPQKQEGKTSMMNFHTNTIFNLNIFVFVLLLLLLFITVA